MKGSKVYENSQNHCYAFSTIVDLVLGPPFFLNYMNIFGNVWRCTFLCFLVFFKELPDGSHVKSPEGSNIYPAGCNVTQLIYI